MNDFIEIFRPLERLGPGSADDTLRALARLPAAPTRRVLDIGCGTGPAARLLAAHTSAEIVALDDHAPNLDALQRLSAGQPWAGRLSPRRASMTDIPFPDAHFELLWAEGSAYIMGFEAALEAWRRLLEPGGHLVVSDLVWRTDAPAPLARAFWQEDYPDMRDTAQRLAQAEALGYRPLAHFELSAAAWANYYRPLAERLAQLRPSLGSGAAWQAIDNEIEVWRRHGGDYAYVMFILQPEASTGDGLKHPW